MMIEHTFFSLHLLYKGKERNVNDDERDEDSEKHMFMRMSPIMRSDMDDRWRRPDIRSHISPISVCDVCRDQNDTPTKL